MTEHHGERNSSDEIINVWSTWKVCFEFDAGLPPVVAVGSLNEFSLTSSRSPSLSIWKDVWITFVNESPSPPLPRWGGGRVRDTPRLWIQFSFGLFEFFIPTLFMAKCTRTGKASDTLLSLQGLSIHHTTLLRLLPLTRGGNKLDFQEEKLGQRS